ncbi:alpha-ketoglutarate-dependent dioxygenase AlkB [Sphingomonas sp. NFR15]|uniref:alpha-ketoglutarate-dependent dioxygenase AlkB family protein n=1 Tax=Sphingomonas sp. NFR15 TaxID=1566282 RepID=UPI0008810049|nr:alpha-ketoglutarate-dependent dioxygenase AlkB [Sphingomonas sp. NFR15]SDA20631.1 Alkylated DNA repair dioxygenase AlkB [Sphingomonas sp. NFR15]
MDLFSAFTDLERIPLPGAEVYYQSSFDIGLPHDVILKRLIDEVPWRQQDVKLWGKTFKQPRLVAWFGDEGTAYRYSGIYLSPLPWTDILIGIKRRVESVTKNKFNSVLLNYYRDNNDSMGMHSDDEKELGHNPTIASVSLGAERPLLLKSKRIPESRTIKIVLASGSLLIMKGETQHNYRHGIAKERQAIGPRVNLTFRTILV